MRQKLRFKNVIIGLTGNSLDEELLDFVVSGCDIALTKPLRSDALDDLLAFLRHNNGGFRSKYDENKTIIFNNNSSNKPVSGMNCFEWQHIDRSLPLSTTVPSGVSGSKVSNNGSWWGFKQKLN